MLLEVEKVTKYYGQFQALHPISITLKKGEIVGFLGPNGAGKSTLMNILSGYLAPTSGSIKINGIELMDEPLKSRQLVGYLPEQAPLYYELTAKEYLTFIAQVRLPKQSPLHISQAVDQAMNQLQIYPLRNRLITTLSKGYKQRVGIASTLIGTPPLLIWDEPSVGLDPQQLHEIHQLLLTLKKDHTILLSSHILAEIDLLCDRIIVINQGKLLAVDTPVNLKKNLHLHKDIEIELSPRLTDNEFIDLKQKLPEDTLIEEISAANNEKDSSLLRFRFSNKYLDDPRILLYSIIKASPWSILYFKAHENTLEETFLSLTQQRTQKE